jgi:hypothetical protein
MARQKLEIAPSQIGLLLGRRGSGKSAGMAWYARSAFEAGKPVFFWPEGFLRFGTSFDMRDLVSLSDSLDGGLILIDEAHTVMDARRSMSFVSFALSHFITQLRKRKASLLMTTQYGNTLDRRLQDQVDYHGFCSTLNGGRTIQIKWKDTQGRWSPPGSGTRAEPPRKRLTVTIRRAQRIWPYYDTYAVASLADVLRIDRESVIGSGRVDKTVTELPIVRQAVIAAVEAGSQWIQPGNFVWTIQETYQLEISPPQLGKYLAGLGLPRTKQSSGTFYQLPPADQLEEWKSGAMMPG